MPRPSRPHPYRKVVTRYILDGKQVPKSTPGAVKQTTHTTTYYADVPGAGTIALKTTDLAVAWKRLNDALKEQHQRDLGVRDHYSDHARTPLAGHLARWLEVLAAKGTGQQQRDTIDRRLANLFALAGWTKLAHITADSTIVALAKLQTEAPVRGTKRGRSAQTRNHYLTHLRGFCGWLVDSGRLARNPVAGVEKINVETDQRHKRRAPERGEVAELFAWLHSPAAPVRLDMTGPCRALGYKVAMATGYRAGELRTLTRGSFDLDAATVTLPAAEDKRRKSDRHPLPAWLVEELRAWFAADGLLWDGFPESHPGRLLRADLDAARAAWIAGGGNAASDFLKYEIAGPNGPLFWDMHALRVFYVTELANQPGMDLKTLMTLARHSTPQLSLNVYARAREDNLRAATDQLKPLDAPVSPPPTDQ